MRGFFCQTRSIENLDIIWKWLYLKWLKAFAATWHEGVEREWKHIESIKMEIEHRMHFIHFATCAIVDDVDGPKVARRAMHFNNLIKHYLTLIHQRNGSTKKESEYSKINRYHHKTHYHQFAGLCLHRFNHFIDIHNEDHCQWSLFFLSSLAKIAAAEFLLLNCGFLLGKWNFILFIYIQDLIRRFSDLAAGSILNDILI